MQTDADQVVLVDLHDNPLGNQEKLSAHRQGRLHRAFSVLLRNCHGQLLLQRRAPGKYHSGGLWSNTCCSHPRPGEDLLEAGRRRLGEEMGLDVALERAFSFIYRTEFADGLVEYEFDHVLIGQHDGDPDPDPAEAMDWRWESPAVVEQQLHDAPDRFTAWFAPVLCHWLAGSRGHLGRMPVGVIEAPLVGR